MQVEGNETPSVENADQKTKQTLVCFPEKALFLAPRSSSKTGDWRALSATINIFLITLPSLDIEGSFRFDVYES